MRFFLSNKILIKTTKNNKIFVLNINIVYFISFTLIQVLCFRNIREHIIIDTTQEECKQENILLLNLTKI